MSEPTSTYEITPGQRVRVKGRDELGAGEVLRISDNFGVYVADVVFELDDDRRLETIPLERLDIVPVSPPVSRTRFCVN